VKDIQVTSKTRRLPPVRAFALWVGLLLLGTACLNPTATLAAPVKVTVSILPQAWFVEQIGGDLVEVSVLVGPGHSPAIYEPTPRQMATLEQANLFRPTSSSRPVFPSKRACYLAFKRCPARR